jgi:hypothetical protein
MFAMFFLLGVYISEEASDLRERLEHIEKTTIKRSEDITDRLKEEIGDLCWRLQRLEDVTVGNLKEVQETITGRLDKIDRGGYESRRTMPQTAPASFEIATQIDLERAVDAAFQTVGSTAANYMGLLIKTARGNLRGKRFDESDLIALVRTRLTDTKDLE